MIVGVVVWGLILYAAFKFRRRHEDEIPVQTRYNLPIEILYTVAPVVMVLVFFYFTVQTQNDVLATASESGEADHTVDVVGQQWSWSFNYRNEESVGSTTRPTTSTPSARPPRRPRWSSRSASPWRSTSPRPTSSTPSGCPRSCSRWTWSPVATTPSLHSHPGGQLRW